jgi:hypothetical protein
MEQDVPPGPLMPELDWKNIIADKNPRPNERLRERQEYGKTQGNLCRIDRRVCLGVHRRAFHYYVCDSAL